ncbi:M24 family metallopeptidase [Aestuariispira insulae]|uniref:Xaa-Pro dipeptidase n=1 Tax=Aestuariispira insulae TaxID=1461337 RepID=A0A3D9HHS1_9PROT|nr:Xaa-Pro peptidase family protein [Aestuariispira insulae]RED49082.1 Xaa-Pro dipeptidase [Aestuariispira insulae]
MTLGVGGSTMEAELARLNSCRARAVLIGDQERAERVGRAQTLMRENGIDAIYLDATSSLTYFTGARFYQSERIIGAVLTAAGDLAFICPAFEEEKLREGLSGTPKIHCWEEHESPFALLTEMLISLVGPGATVGLDEQAPFFLFDGLRAQNGGFDLVNAKTVTAGCRMCKTAPELALMQQAKDMTLEVQKATARILRPGIKTTEVVEFIDKAHRKMGADNGSTFCIVLFGEATAYPHGVSYAQELQEGDMVLIDTGCSLHGYQSDITRSYVFGAPNDRQRQIWDLEKAAQAAAFEAAQLGALCEDVDRAARGVIEAAGFGPGYKVPGLPHRTGHGVGMDIHEWAYLVQGDKTPLKPGMCFSNEPMICLYGEFGVRLEDHFYMGSDGPVWFTQPSHSIDDPFGLGA